MTTYRYSVGDEERATAERVNALLDAAQIGDLFERPAPADDRRLWVITRDASHGKAIWEINPDEDDWTYAAQYEVPGDIIPLRRAGGA
jgi:hypothetical protein